MTSPIAVTANPPRVVAVVLSWNNLPETAACLRALGASDYPALSVRVVDNASADGVAAALRAAFPGVALTVNATNLGYTGGNNPAIRAALAEGADYVWLVNADSVVPPDALGRLVALAEADATLGLLSPLIARDGGAGGYDFAGGVLDFAKGTYLYTEDARQGRQWQATQPGRFVLTGTALLIRRAVVERIGLLDDRFFAYWEDTDYCARALAAGFRAHLAFDIAIAHAAKPRLAAGEGKPHYYYLMTRNEILFWRKHLGRFRALRPTWWTLRRQAALARAARAHPAAARAIMAGLWDGLRGRGGPYDPARQAPAPVRALLARLAP